MRASTATPENYLCIQEEYRCFDGVLSVLWKSDADRAIIRGIVWMDMSDGQEDFDIIKSDDGSYIRSGEIFPDDDPTRTNDPYKLLAWWCDEGAIVYRKTYPWPAATDTSSLLEV